jgi:predicted DsbA family dithiol-disulfide isomerase
VVEKLKQEHAVEVDWLPYLLRPDMPAEGTPVPEYIRAKRGSTGDRLKQMAQAQGLPMVSPDWIPNTRKAHEATEHARAQGKLVEFHRVVFRKYYGEGQDIGQWEVLRAAATEAGLDPEAMQRAVESETYRSVPDEQTEQAHSLGLDGVPAYILNDRYAIVGAQPYAVFQQALAQIANGVESDV